MFKQTIIDLIIRIYLQARYSHLFTTLDMILHKPSEQIMQQVMEFVSISKIEGDYLEFGVYNGNSFIRAFYLANKFDLNAMRFFAFDSFEGLPDVNGVDQTYAQFKKGDYRCTADKFKENICRRGVDTKRVQILSGWYDKVLIEKNRKILNIRKAAIIHIDCDLYESTILALDFIYPYLQDGTIIVFDDWYYYKGNPYMGEQRALREWLKKHKNIFLIEFHKMNFVNSFIVFKKNRANSKINSIK